MSYPYAIDSHLAESYDKLGYEHGLRAAEAYNSNTTYDYGATSPTVSSWTNLSASSPNHVLGSSTSEAYLNPSHLRCLHPGCEYQTKRQYDLDIHYVTHLPSFRMFDCPERACGRQDKHGSDRKDHLREHLRKVHVKDIPKGGKGRRKD